MDMPVFPRKRKEQWGRTDRAVSARSSKQLMAVFLLIDIRHEPSANDRMMYQWIVEQGLCIRLSLRQSWTRLKKSQVTKTCKDAVNRGA